MEELAATLGHLPPFAGVPAAALESSARHWRRVPLQQGEVLWTEGSAVEEVAVVLSGRLEAWVEGRCIGAIGVGEMVGETAAFFAGGTRALTLTASGPTELLALPVPAMRTLRWQRSPVYLALLAGALRELTRRLREMDLRIARASAGPEAQPRRGDRSWLARWREVFTLERDPTFPPDLCPLLRRLPGLRGLEPKLLADLALAFYPQSVTEGEILCVQGEPGSCAWLIGSGRLDVLEQVDDERAERLATLGEGERLGLMALVDGGARAASCVAIEPGWLFRLESEAYGALTGDVRMHWDECMVATLGQQLRGANLAVARGQSHRR